MSDESNTNSRRFEKVIAIFQAALETDSIEDADQFARERAEGDLALAAEAAAMIHAHRKEETSAKGLEGHAHALVKDATRNAHGAFETDLPEHIGPFLVLRRIATGGMGTVYEAEQDEPRRRVALKVLRADQLSPDAMVRFELEGNLLARLSHPGIAKIHSMGKATVLGGAMPYIAMEYIDGQSITAHAHGRPVDECVELVRDVAEALSHAHEHAILHRDIKPNNILVDARGRPRLLDFGIARVDAPDATRHGLTSTGMFIGTLNYMSPEQARGGGAPLDVRSDLYGLALVAYELLAGAPARDFRKRPLHEATADLLTKPVPDVRTRRPEVSNELSAILAKALSIEPERRYRDVRSFSDDLRRYLADETVSARPPSRTYRVRKFVRRNRLPVALAVATVLAVLVGLVAALTERGRAEDALSDAHVLKNQAETERERARVALNDARVLKEQSDAQHRARLIETAFAEINKGNGYQAERILLEVAQGHTTGRVKPFEFRLLEAHLEDASELVVLPVPSLFWVPSARAEALAAIKSPRQICYFERDARRTTLIDMPPSLPPITKLVFASNDRQLIVHHASSGISFVDREALAFDRHVKLDPNLAPRRTPPFAPIAWTASDQKLRWWDLGTGQPLGGAFATDANVGRGVAAGSDWFALQFAEGEEITLVHLKDGRTRTVRAGSGSLFGITSDLRWLWSGLTGPTLWDLNNEAVQWRAKETGIAFYDVIVDEVRSTITSLGLHGQMSQRDLATGRRLRSWFDRRWNSVHMSLVIDGADLWRVGQEALLRFASEEEVPRVLAHAEGNAPHDYVYLVAWHPEGRYLASAAWGNRVVIWDTWTGAAVRELKGLPIHPNHVAPISLAWSPDGRTLLVHRVVGRCTLWNVWAGKRLTHGKLTHRPYGLENDGGIWVRSPNGIRCASFAEAMEPVQSFPTLTRAAAWMFDHPRGADASHFGWWSASGRRIAVPKRVRWEAPKREPWVDWGVPRGFSVYDRDSEDPFWVQARPSEVIDVLLVEDGTRLIAGLRSGAIEIWDVDTRNRIGVLDEHQSYVASVALAPDGLTLASGSGDGTVRLTHVAPRRIQQKRLQIAARQARELAPRVAEIRKATSSLEEAIEKIANDPAIPASERNAAWSLLNP